MESKRQILPSSFTSDLFDNKESRKPDVFASIFPPSKGVGRNSGFSWQKQTSGNQPWEDSVDKNNVGSYHGISNKERSSIFQEERVQPCYMSSSLYYGGQEIYSQSSYSHTSESYTDYKKVVGEDDPNGASRGNWWQGSLYY